MTIFIVITNSYALFGPEFGKKKPDKGYTFERKKSDPDLYQVASSSISFLFLLFVPVTPCRLFLVALWLLFCFCLEFVWEMADRWRHLQLKANRKWKKFIFSIKFLYDLVCPSLSPLVVLPLRCGGVKAGPNRKKYLFWSSKSSEKRNNY